MRHQNLIQIITAHRTFGSRHFLYVENQQYVFADNSSASNGLYQIWIRQMKQKKKI